MLNDDYVEREGSELRAFLRWWQRATEQIGFAFVLAWEGRK